jgi:kumamolisin
MTAIPQIHPYFKKSKRSSSDHMSARAAGSGPWSVPDLCAAYQWPTGLAGGGVIAIVELGGGWTLGDMQTYFASIHQPVPLVTDVSVDGTTNSPGGDADGEVALDIQVAAAAYYVATGKPAIIRVYWAGDIATAVRAAIKDGCDVCSISWGADEANWGAGPAQDMEQAAIEAAAAGMIVFAASGDNDSSDGGPTPANVDLPAGCPHVIGTGGTNKTRSAESVWNNSPGNASGEGGGGGYSTLFPMPAWQLAGGAPSGPGRMVPDVAANADPNTGYEIFYGGSAQIVGGTSAVAPLYAGLAAAAGKKIGFVGDKLWGSSGCFTDVTVGDNGMYHAQVGPDPCTGLGVPIGNKIDALLAGTSVPAPVPTPTPTPTPTPAPPGTSVTQAQAVAWAESALPQAKMNRHQAAQLIEQGLRAHWPASSSGVTISDAIAWAESDLPHATMSYHAVKQFVERGLRKHWPKGSP